MKPIYSVADIAKFAGRFITVDSRANKNSLFLLHPLPEKFVEDRRIGFFYPSYAFKADVFSDAGKAGVIAFLSDASINRLPFLWARLATAGELSWAKDLLKEERAFLGAKTNEEALAAINEAFTLLMGSPPLSLTEAACEEYERLHDPYRFQ